MVPGIIRKVSPATDRIPAAGPDQVPLRRPANTAFTDPDHLIAAVRRALREIQRQPRLIDGALTETGLALRPDSP